MGDEHCDALVRALCAQPPRRWAPALANQRSTAVEGEAHGLHGTAARGAMTRLDLTQAQPSQTLPPPPLPHRESSGEADRVPACVCALFVVRTVFAPLCTTPAHRLALSSSSQPHGAQLHGAEPSTTLIAVLPCAVQFPRPRDASSQRPVGQAGRAKTAHSEVNGASSGTDDRHRSSDSRRGECASHERRHSGWTEAPRASAKASSSSPHCDRRSCAHPNRSRISCRRARRGYDERGRGCVGILIVIRGGVVVLFRVIRLLSVGG